MNNRLIRNGFMYLVLAVAILVVLFVWLNPAQETERVPISTLLTRVQSAVESGDRPEILISGPRINANVGGRVMTATVNDSFDINRALSERQLNLTASR